MSLRDRLPAPETRGPRIKLDALLDLLKPSIANELRELLHDRSITGSALATLINQLCDEHNTPHLKLKQNSVNRYRKEML
jgi:hypothetical protein